MRKEILEVTFVMCEYCEVEISHDEDYIYMETQTPDDIYASTARLRHDSCSEDWDIEVIDADTSCSVWFPVAHCPWCGRELS